MTSFEVADGGDLAPVAKALCAVVRPGAIVHLHGPIGAGKTTLVQACAHVLGVTEPVTSPTFALAHRYQGDVPVSHLDLYRLESQPLRDPADLRDYLDEASIAFVEWPELGSDWLPQPDVAVRIEMRPNATRAFVLARSPLR
jgi:tRNA threonylcarbamoyladenosine biosynthesis protein TsaE